MFGMRKGLKHITINGTIVSMADDYSNVIIKDESGYEVKFNGIIIAKPLQEYLEVGVPLTLYFLRFKNGSKLAGALYALERDGEKHFSRADAVSVCKTLASEMSARSKFLYRTDGVFTMYNLVCFIISFAIYGAFASIKNIFAPVGLVFACIFFYWAWYPRLRSGTYAGISEIDKIFGKENAIEKSYSNSKY